MDKMSAFLSCKGSAIWDSKVIGFASDCEIGNESSLRFYLNMGFEEANRIVCFTKKEDREMRKGEISK
ncbi:MAG: hypothetical protein NC412_05700 [Roseburia sp.]|nr:hypothetical protein [Roseburia sp.]MCM1277854.1 hypothetical protein [Robinsoniella sp.]